jgi:hypothetical protein
VASRLGLPDQARRVALRAHEKPAEAIEAGNEERGRQVDVDDGPPAS